MKAKPFIGQKIIVTRKDLLKIPAEKRWINYLDIDFISDISSNNKEAYLEKAKGWILMDHLEDFYDFQEEKESEKITPLDIGLKTGLKVMILEDCDYNFQKGSYAKVEKIILGDSFKETEVTLKKLGSEKTITVPITKISYNRSDFENELKNSSLGFVNGVQYPVIAAHHIGKQKTYYFAVGWCPLNPNFGYIAFPSLGDIVEDKDGNLLVVEKFDKKDYQNFLKKYNLLSYITRVVETSDNKIIDAYIKEQSKWVSHDYWKNTQTIQDLEGKISYLQGELNKAENRLKQAKNKSLKNDERLKKVNSLYKKYVVGDN